MLGQECSHSIYHSSHCEYGNHSHSHGKSALPDHCANCGLKEGRSRPMQNTQSTQTTPNTPNIPNTQSLHSSSDASTVGNKSNAIEYDKGKEIDAMEATKEKDSHIQESSKDVEDAKKEAVKLSICSSCYQVRYCSRDCQKQHWKVHKPFCLSVRNAHTESDDSLSTPTTSFAERLQEQAIEIQVPRITLSLSSLTSLPSHCRCSMRSCRNTSTKSSPPSQRQ